MTIQTVCTDKVTQCICIAPIAITSPLSVQMWVTQCERQLTPNICLHVVEVCQRAPLPLTVTRHWLQLSTRQSTPIKDQRPTF